MGGNAFYTMSVNDNLVINELNTNFGRKAVHTNICYVPQRSSELDSSGVDGRQNDRPSYTCSKVELELQTDYHGEDITIKLQQGDRTIWYQNGFENNKKFNFVENCVNTSSCPQFEISDSDKNG